ncbi:MAG: hypothetical protein PVSMB4_16470 [Ktedonobacterales bacterium]
MNRVGFLFGAAFGFVLAAAQLNNYTVIHNMLLLRDPQPYLILSSAIVVAAPLLWLLRTRHWRTPLGGPLTITPSRVERKFVLGGMVFGTGWAVAGGCPAPLLGMIAAGRVLAVFVVAGLFGGIMLRDVVVARTTAAQAGAERTIHEPVEAAVVGL